MNGLVDAILAALAASPYPVFDTAVPQTVPDGWSGVWPPPAYHLLTVPGSPIARDRVLSDDLADVNVLVQVTSTAATPAGARTVMAAACSLLAPAGGTTLLPASGWRAWLRHFSSEPVTVDLDVTIPETTLHPAFGVDIFRLIATPA